MESHYKHKADSTNPKDSLTKMEAIKMSSIMEDGSLVPGGMEAMGAFSSGFDPSLSHYYLGKPSKKNVDQPWTMFLRVCPPPYFCRNVHRFETQKKCFKPMDRPRFLKDALKRPGTHQTP